MKKIKEVKVFTVILIAVVVSLAVFVLMLTVFNTFSRDLADRDQEGIGEGGSQQEEVEGRLLTNSLPETFPQDFPLYPGTTFINAWEATGNQTQGHSALWESTDSPDKITAFFESQLTQNEWQITASNKEENFATISFQKEKTSGFVGIARDGEGKTMITVTLGVKEN